MTPQDILFTASIVFFVLAVIFIGLAVFVFFARNIPDVRADLSGKKRAEAVARIENSSGRGRRRNGGRREAAPPQVAQVAQPAPSQQQTQRPAPQPAVRKIEPAAASTTILPEDDTSTTILPAQAASDALEGFRMVRKVVLMENTKFVQPKRQ